MEDGKTFFAGSRFGQIYRIKEIKNNKFEIETIVKQIDRSTDKSYKKQRNSIKSKSQFLKKESENHLELNNVRAMT